MELKPEVNVEKDKIEISGVPRKFYVYVRERLFAALKTSIPSLSITETPESSLEDLVRIEIGGIDKLDKGQFDILEQTMDKFYLALHRLLVSLKGRERNEFRTEEVSHVKRAIVSMKIPKDKSHPHRKLVLKFLEKFRDFARVSNRLIAVLSHHLGTEDMDEVSINFSEESLSTAAYALELFFGTIRVYYDPMSDCYLRLNAPSGPNDIYQITIGKGDPTLPSPVDK